MNFLTHVFERDGLVWVKSVHRFYNPETQTTYLAKYLGNACLLHDRIFVVQYPTEAKDLVAETIVHPTRRRQLSVLQGVSLSVAFRTRQTFTTRVALEYLGTSIDIKQELRRAGIVPAGSTKLSPSVLRALGPAPDFAEFDADDAEL